MRGGDSPPARWLKADAGISRPRWRRTRTANTADFPLVTSAAKAYMLPPPVGERGFSQGQLFP